MRHQRDSKRRGRGENQFSLAAVVFVALMFLTISGVNVYMQSDRSMRQAGESHQQRTIDAGGMDRRPTIHDQR
jgi:hypothetical protein